MPKPGAAPPASHTVDGSGFVDNSGATSDERARTETSGMRATEASSERPTGTPGSGLPLKARAPRVERSSSRVTAGAPPAAVIGRFAQALCDRESACDRVGEARPWASSATCVAGVRAQVQDDVDAASCSDGFDASAMSGCLGAIRQAACGDRIGSIVAVTGCEPRALCR